jgi:hypothetical protein
MHGETSPGNVITVPQSEEYRFIEAIGERVRLECPSVTPPLHRRLVDTIESRRRRLISQSIVRNDNSPDIQAPLHLDYTPTGLDEQRLNKLRSFTSGFPKTPSLIQPELVSVSIAGEMCRWHATDNISWRVELPGSKFLS